RRKEAASAPATPFCLTSGDEHAFAPGGPEGSLAQNGVGRAGNGQHFYGHSLEGGRQIISHALCGKNIVLRREPVAFVRGGVYLVSILAQGAHGLPYACPG